MGASSEIIVAVCVPLLMVSSIAFIHFGCLIVWIKSLPIDWFPKKAIATVFAKITLRWASIIKTASCTAFKANDIE